MVVQQRLEGMHPRGEVRRFVLKPVYKRATDTRISQDAFMYTSHTTEKDVNCPQ